MRIIANKLKSNNDKLIKKSIKIGLKELRDDYSNNVDVTMKGNKDTLSFITKDNYAISHIETVLNNYAIPYKIIK